MGTIKKRALFGSQGSLDAQLVDRKKVDEDLRKGRSLTCAGK